MKTYIVAFSEDYQLSISLFALLEDAQRYYCEQVCEIYEYEQCGNLVAEMEAGNMTKAYELAKDLFGGRVDSTVDNMVLEEREVPGSLQTEPEGAEEAARWDTIRTMAKDKHESEGNLEIDENAVVSEGDDNGAYIQCWKWIEFAGTPLDKEPAA